MGILNLAGRMRQCGGHHFFCLRLLNLVRSGAAAVLGVSFLTTSRYLQMRLNLGSASQRSRSSRYTSSLFLRSSSTVSVSLEQTFSSSSRVLMEVRREWSICFVVGVRRGGVRRGRGRVGSLLKGLQSTMGGISQLGVEGGGHFFGVGFHLPFEDFVGLREAGFEDRHEGIQVLLRVLRHETHSQSCLSDFDHGEFDAVDVYACIGREVPLSIMMRETSLQTTSLPTKTGMMAQGLPKILCPLASSFPLRQLQFSSTFFLRSAPSRELRMRSWAREVAAWAGLMTVACMQAVDMYFSISTMRLSLMPMKPMFVLRHLLPVPTRITFERSTRFCTYHIPRPLAPRWPKSCAQSISRKALYCLVTFWQKFRSGESESIEKSPSVTTRMAPSGSFSLVFLTSSTMASWLRCSNFCMLRVAAREPSWRQLWESWSMMMWSYSRTSPLMTPKPAIQPVEQIRMFVSQYSSSSRCSCRQYLLEPRPEGVPAELSPKFWAASMAASLAALCWARPRQSAEAQLTPQQRLQLSSWARTSVSGPVSMRRLQSQSSFFTNLLTQRTASQARSKRWVPLGLPKLGILTVSKTAFMSTVRGATPVYWSRLCMLIFDFSWTRTEFAISGRLPQTGNLVGWAVGWRIWGEGVGEGGLAWGWGVGGGGVLNFEGHGER